jgi:hypothetical protein
LLATTLTCLAELEAAAASGVITSWRTSTSRTRQTVAASCDLPSRAVRSRLHGIDQRQYRRGSESAAFLLRGGGAHEETSADDADDDSEESTADSSFETDDEGSVEKGGSDAAEKEEEEDIADGTESDDSEEEDESEEEKADQEESRDAESDEEDAEESTEPNVAAAPIRSPPKAKKRRKLQHRTDVQRQDGKDRPDVPPNAIYRFWLTKGRVGHIVVASMAVMSEFVTCYLPFLASFVTWLLKATGIYDAEKAIRVAEARRAAAMRGHAVGSPKRGRFGGNKKAQTARKKAADQIAVGKLRSLAGDGGAGGIARDSRYCHLSPSFMKHHALGPYSLEIDAKAARDGLVQDVVGESVAEHGEELVLDALKGEKGDGETQEETEEEEDWVVQALSNDQIQKEVVHDLNSGEQPHRVEPYVKKETGSSGQNSVSFGIEFTIGGSRGKPNSRDAMLKAAAESRSSIAGGERRRKVVGQRNSDRDGGGGVLGRIRAAGGDMIPARVLGAYPGDAVPIEEAGSANGLFGLARRYGYGDWSDDSESDDNHYDDDGDNDDDDDNILAKIKSRQRNRPKSRRRLKPSSSPSGSNGSSNSNPQGRSTSRGRRRRSSSSASGSRRRSRGRTDAFKTTNSGWDEILGSDNRHSFGGGFRRSSGQEIMPRTVTATPTRIRRSQVGDTDKLVTPHVFAEKRRTVLKDAFVRHPMERTREKEKERRHSDIARAHTCSS